MRRKMTAWWVGVKRQTDRQRTLRAELAAVLWENRRLRRERNQLECDLAVAQIGEAALRNALGKAQKPWEYGLATGNAP